MKIEQCRTTTNPLQSGLSGVDEKIETDRNTRCGRMAAPQGPTWIKSVSNTVPIEDGAHLVSRTSFRIIRFEQASRRIPLMSGLEYVGDEGVVRNDAGFRSSCRTARERAASITNQYPSKLQVSQRERD